MHYQRASGVEAAPLQTETVLHHAESNNFCVLNKTAAFLWDRLETARTPDELVAELCAGFEGVDDIVAREDVADTLRQFTELGMVTQQAPSD